MARSESRWTLRTGAAKQPNGSRSRQPERMPSYLCGASGAPMVVRSLPVMEHKANRRLPGLRR